ncbi:hypothetical protein F6455_06370 [Proteobacteria bacterium 005FR1]|nr:hypothetical protein [Proteobacteria bacterium 005FR1]
MKARSLLVAGLAIVPLSSFAVEDLSYTYIEADYVDLDIDEYGDSGDFLDDFDNGSGWALRGSYGFDNSPFGFADSWFIFANWSETEADIDFVDDTGVFFPADTDVIRFDLGAGVAVPVNDMSQMVFKVAYSDLDIDDFNLGGTADEDFEFDRLNDDSSDGYFLEGAWRGQVTPQLELKAGLRYTDIEETDGFGFVGNAIWEFTEQVGGVVFADIGSDVGTYGIGIRFDLE